MNKNLLEYVTPAICKLELSPELFIAVSGNIDDYNNDNFDW